jgi:Fe-Mn family superoxide dismutase
MKKNELLAGIDLKGIEEIVRDSISKSCASTASRTDEAYVAEPKKYKMVSELVSQRTKESHTKLYDEYLATMNRVSGELDSAELRDKSNSKHSAYRSLKLDEAYNVNAVWLHELYFANCFDPHSEVFMNSISYMRLERDFGTFDDWQRDFTACAVSCGQGWAVCGYNMFLQRFVNTMISNHSQDVMVGLYPVIVVDCHEHAYYRDYMQDKQSYVVSQLKELNWTVIEERVNKADALAAALKRGI